MDAFVDGALKLLLEQGPWGLIVFLLGYIAREKNKEVISLTERLVGSSEARIKELTLCIESQNASTAAVREVKAEVAVLVAQSRNGRN